MTGIIGAIAAINVRGIRQSSLVLNALTIAKLTPLVIFIAAGLFAIDPARLIGGATPSLQGLSTTALLLIYAFGGYEVVPVPAGEARDPRRAVPFALVMTIVIATLVMTLAQVVALGTLPGLATSKTPLADAAALFLGASGAALITIGAICSTSGNNMGQALSGSRNLYALAEQGDLPAVLRPCPPAVQDAGQRGPGDLDRRACAGRVRHVRSNGRGQCDHPLIVYLATCAATLRLRSRIRQCAAVAPASFVVPLGPVIPVTAIVIAVTILSGVTALQFYSVTAAIAAGAVLYLFATRAAAPRPATAD